MVKGMFILCYSYRIKNKILRQLEIVHLQTMFLFLKWKFHEKPTLYVKNPFARDFYKIII